MSKPNTREDAIFLSLWRRAGLDNPPPPITLSSHSLAISVRAKLFRVIKPYRAGRLEDAELLMAAENWTVAVNDCTITFVRKVTQAAAEEIAALLGLTEADIMSPEEKASADRMAAMLSNLKDKE
jgi:hypothetical protein